MPLYSTLCASCGAKNIMFRKVSERDRVETCSCGALPIRALDAPYVQPEIPSYISPATGELISSRAQRREDLKKSGCIEWEPGAKEAIERTRKAKIEQDIQKVCNGVDSIVADLNASGRL